MEEGDFYGQETLEVNDDVDQEDSDKAKTDYDAFLGFYSMLQRAGGNYRIVKVARNLIGEDGKSIGTYHDNLLHNTDFYEVK